jgi:AraC-like DNA-binding protein
MEESEKSLRNWYSLFILGIGDGNDNHTPINDSPLISLICIVPLIRVIRVIRVLLFASLRVIRLIRVSIMEITENIYQRVVAAKLFIDDNYSEAIDLKEISGRAYLSKFHFHRLFTKIYRKTPHAYLTRKRIEKAKELLAENKAVTEVCNEVGFESVGSFSVLFKKEIGFAPQYYRNMAWLKKQQSKAQPRRFIPHCFIESYKLDT